MANVIVKPEEQQEERILRDFGGDKSKEAKEAAETILAKSLEVLEQLRRKERDNE